MQVETGVLYNVAFETPLQIAGRTLESVEAVCRGHSPNYDIGNLYLFASRDLSRPLALGTIFDFRILFKNKEELSVEDGEISVPATAHVDTEVYYHAHPRFGEQDPREDARQELSKLIMKAEENLISEAEGN